LGITILATSADDMPDKRTNSTHVRLSDEADAVLELLAQARGGTDSKASVLAELCEEALLGKGHALRVAAMRFARLGLSGRNGE
jgi:hypothetical protein